MKSAAEKHGSMTADGDNPAWDSLPTERRADLAQRMAVYAGMVTGMDRNIGRLIADLRTHAELENTLVFFLSDNGACAEWEPFGFDLQRVENPRPGTGINVGTPGHRISCMRVTTSSDSAPQVRFSATAAAGRTRAIHPGDSTNTLTTRGASVRR